jgi:hypothetical protein
MVVRACALSAQSQQSVLRGNPPQTRQQPKCVQVLCLSKGPHGSGRLIQSFTTINSKFTRQQFLTMFKQVYARHMRPTSSKCRFLRFRTPLACQAVYGSAHMQMYLPTYHRKGLNSQCLNKLAGGILHHWQRRFNRRQTGDSIQGHGVRVPDGHSAEAQQHNGARAAGRNRYECCTVLQRACGWLLLRIYSERSNRRSGGPAQVRYSRRKACKGFLAARPGVRDTASEGVDCICQGHAHRAHRQIGPVPTVVSRPFQRFPRRRKFRRQGNNVCAKRVIQ